MKISIILKDGEKNLCSQREFDLGNYPHKRQLISQVIDSCHQDVLNLFLPFEITCDYCGSNPRIEIETDIGDHRLCKYCNDIGIVMGRRGWRQLGVYDG